MAEESRTRGHGQGDKYDTMWLSSYSTKEEKHLDAYYELGTISSPLVDYKPTNYDFY
jgi:hypothetical protein